jgi:hypothetical protein
VRLTCPACHAEASLDVLVGREAEARALATFIERNVPMGDLVVRYIALFRPPKRRLSMARVVALFAELQPDIERGAIARKGRDWPAPLELWRAAIEQVLANRDKGSITLPLTGHGYLYEVMLGLADKLEAQAERSREADGRNRSITGPATGAKAVGGVLAAAQHHSHTVVITATPPPSYTAGPSRAALALQAEIEAARKARAGMPATEDGDPAP